MQWYNFIQQTKSPLDVDNICCWCSVCSNELLEMLTFDYLNIENLSIKILRYRQAGIEILVSEISDPVAASETGVQIRNIGPALLRCFCKYCIRIEVWLFPCQPQRIGQNFTSHTILKLSKMLIFLIYWTCDFKAAFYLFYTSKICPLLAANSRNLNNYLKSCHVILQEYYDS